MHSMILIEDSNKYQAACNRLCMSKCNLITTKWKSSSDKCINIKVKHNLDSYLSATPYSNDKALSLEGDGQIYPYFYKPFGSETPSPLYYPIRHCHERKA